MRNDRHGKLNQKFLIKRWNYILLFEMCSTLKRCWGQMGRNEDLREYYAGGGGELSAVTEAL